MRVIALIILAALALVGAAPASAADRLDVFDSEGHSTGFATIDQGAGRLDFFDRNSRRTGYGIQRPDGSWDLFRPNGSRLGAIQPGRPSHPGRIILGPSRGK